MKNMNKDWKHLPDGGAVRESEVVAIEAFGSYRSVIRFRQGMTPIECQADCASVVEAILGPSRRIGESLMALVRRLPKGFCVGLHDGTLTIMTSQDGRAFEIVVEPLCDEDVLTGIMSKCAVDMAIERCWDFARGKTA